MTSEATFFAGVGEDVPWDHVAQKITPPWTSTLKVDGLHRLLYSGLGFNWLKKLKKMLESCATPKIPFL